jgi:hypothetical protein
LPPRIRYLPPPFEADRDPDVDDDVTAGHYPDRIWVNTTAGTYFFCVSAGVGAASWTSTTALEVSRREEFNVRGIRETSGPTYLDIGAVADGEYLIRSGSSIIGSAGTGGAGGVSVGDKGDITVTALGLTWTIDNGVVTLAKMADLATQRLVGRNTAGTGVPESLSVSTVVDWIGSTRGTVLFRGAAAWEPLTPGTAGLVLVTAGAGADPSWTTVGTSGLAASAVTYAKLQDISATKRVIGRNTAGSGVAEEVSATQLLDWFGSTRGTLLFRGAAGWSTLVPSTSGHVLTDGGVGADPSWAAPSGSGLTYAEVRRLIARAR